MKQTIAETFVDRSLGFEVTIQAAPLREVRGEWVLDVDPNELQEVVVWSLAHQDASWTGSQVRFVRHWLEMTLEDFAQMLGVTHPAVIKWEKRDDAPTQMAKGTEVLLRLHALKALPAGIWDRLDATHGEESKVESLRRLLDEIPSFDEAHGSTQVQISGHDLPHQTRLRA